MKFYLHENFLNIPTKNHANYISSKILTGNFQHRNWYMQENSSKWFSGSFVAFKDAVNLDANRGDGCGVVIQIT
jgi:hypothetical protein